MQVRAGNASGFADFADDLSLSDIITRFDGNFFQMRVDGKQLVAVVDDCLLYTSDAADEL